MGVVIPAGFGLLSFHTLTTLDPEEMLWTVGVDLSAVTNPQDVADDASATWTDNLAPLTSSIVVLNRTVLKVGPSSTGPTFENTDTIPGTDGGALLPPNSAVLVRKLTSLGGRGGRGRAYLPGISSISGSLDSSGAFSGAAASAVSAGAPLVLLHSDSTAPTLISSFDCEPKIATQRRRLRP